MGNAQDLNEISMDSFHPRDGLEKWVKPVEQSLTVNIDTALFVGPPRYNFAVVVRNHHGFFVESQTRCREGSVQLEVAEALGLKEALSWIKQQPKVSMVVETDCLVLVQAIRYQWATTEGEPMNSYFGVLVEDCKNLQKIFLCRVSFFFKRSANADARTLLGHPI